MLLRNNSQLRQRAHLNIESPAACTNKPPAIFFQVKILKLRHLKSFPEQMFRFLRAEVWRKNRNGWRNKKYWGPVYQLWRLPRAWVDWVVDPLDDVMVLAMCFSEMSATWNVEVHVNPQIQIVLNKRKNLWWTQLRRLFFANSTVFEERETIFQEEKSKQELTPCHVTGDTSKHSELKCKNMTLEWTVNIQVWTPGD